METTCCMQHSCQGKCRVWLVIYSDRIFAVVVPRSWLWKYWYAFDFHVLFGNIKACWSPRNKYKHELNGNGCCCVWVIMSDVCSGWSLSLLVQPTWWSLTTLNTNSENLTIHFIVYCFHHFSSSKWPTVMPQPVSQEPDDFQPWAIAKRPVYITLGIK